MGAAAAAHLCALVRHLLGFGWVMRTSGCPACASTAGGWARTAALPPGSASLASPMLAPATAVPMPACRACVRCDPPCLRPRPHAAAGWL